MKQKLALSNRIVPTEDEKLRAFALLYNRLIRAFTLYFWKSRILPMLDVHATFADNQFEVESVRNACVESVLMSVRDLDDFFRPKTTNDRESDFRAADFNGYTSPVPFLSAAERDSINQWVAHLTYQPVWTNTTGIAPDTSRVWNTVELVGKAARAVIGFM